MVEDEIAEPKWNCSEGAKILITFEGFNLSKMVVEDGFNVFIAVTLMVVDLVVFFVALWKVACLWWTSDIDLEFVF